VSAVTIVPTGTANMASVVAAFRRLGVETRQARSASDVADADRVVLPGVGTFGSAVDALDAFGVRGPLRDRIASDGPTLAICVGMQVLCAASTESPDSTGLGVVPVTVDRFTTAVRVPQMGWNRVQPVSTSRFIEAGWAYFANSFRLVSAPDGWRAAVADHGGRFIAAIERGSVLACQFHPELSGPWGADLIRRWFDSSPEAT
jgi:imidazole glycerol-phosphate synthase subunit HisH